MKHSVRIIGNKAFVERTEAALDLLYDKAKHYYDFVSKYVGIIEYADKGSGMYVWETPPRYKVGKATVGRDVLWYASTIVHDANHSRQYQDYLLHNPECRGVVPRVVYYGEEPERDSLVVQEAVLKELEAPELYITWVKGGLSRKYWEVDYGNRWW